MTSKRDRSGVITRLEPWVTWAREPLTRTDVMSPSTGRHLAAVVQRTAEDAITEKVHQVWRNELSVAIFREPGKNGDRGGLERACAMPCDRSRNRTRTLRRAAGACMTYVVDPLGSLVRSGPPPAVNPLPGICVHGHP